MLPESTARYYRRPDITYLRITDIPFPTAADVGEVVPPVELEPKVTVSATVVGLPLASCSWTVIGPRVGLEDAAPETGAEVMTNFAGDPAVMLKALVVAEVKDPSVAVSL